MRLVPLLFIAIMGLFSARSEAAVRQFSKGQLLKEIATWQEEVTDFEDLEDLDSKVRLDWLYRLQFLVERRYDGSEASLLRILKFMLELDKHGDKVEKSEDHLMVERLLEAIEKVRERHEPLWTFVKAYVDDIDPTQPPTLDQFARTRDYINNFQGIQVRKISGEELDALLSALDQPAVEKNESKAK